jgi:single stranded DNA-binding protein
LGTASGQLLRPAASRALLSRFLPNSIGPSHKAPTRLGSSGLSLLSAPGKWGKKKEKNSAMSYLNSITLVGFVGSDPEQHQAKGNGLKFTVISVATQCAWKNTNDEWSSKTEWHRIAIFRPRLAEYVATAIKKGSHVLVEGSLVSSICERPNGKSKKSATTKITSWSIRAHVVRRLDRGEPELETTLATADGGGVAEPAF